MMVTSLHMTLDYFALKKLPIIVFLQTKYDAISNTGFSQNCCRKALSKRSTVYSHDRASKLPLARLHDQMASSEKRQI